MQSYLPARVGDLTASLADCADAKVSSIFLQKGVGQGGLPKGSVDAYHDVPFKLITSLMMAVG